MNGKIKNIRVWKLGSLEHQLYPSEQAVKKLADILKEVFDDDSTDIIWGPDIELIGKSGNDNVTMIKVENVDGFLDGMKANVVRVVKEVMEGK